MHTYALRFDCTALTPIGLEGSPGSRLRGGLLAELAAYCPLAFNAPPDPRHAAGCPICYYLNPAPARQSPAPKPYSLHFYPQTGRLQAGEAFSFEVVLLGRAHILPYLISASQSLGRAGFGARRAGRFEVERIHSLLPAVGNPRPSLVWERGQGVLAKPAPFDWESLQNAAEDYLDRGAGDERALRLELLTPLRLVDGEHLARQLDLDVLLERLWGRMRLLSQALGCEMEAPRPDASGLRLAQGSALWEEATGFNTRQGRLHHLSGLVGEAVVEGTRSAWEVALPWLLWGERVGVGKNVVKGQGFYRLTPFSES